MNQKNNVDKLVEILIAIGIMAIMLGMVGVGVDIYLKIKNEGQQVHRFMLGNK